MSQLKNNPYFRFVIPGLIRDPVLFEPMQYRMPERVRQGNQKFGGYCNCSTAWRVGTQKKSVWQTGVTLQALKDYHDMIADVDRRCRRIVSRHPEQIACTKGCAGNCCRIHLTVYPVEAVALARALQAKPPEMRRRIRQQARHTNTFGPCPLLADGACQLYAARAVICRTHGLPVRTEYRGHCSIGFCQKNFRYLSAIPAEDIIDLARLNNRLVDVNRRFVGQMAHQLPPGDRFTIATSLLMAV
jgi:Fe-S-cluster containining protein